jgi:galactitol-specific phosphotransferase system IIB component
MTDVAAQVERRLSEKNIDAAVDVQDSTTLSNDGKTIHIYVIIPSVEQKYGYSFSLSASVANSDNACRKEIALAADKLVKEIYSDFSTYIEHKNRTVVMVEDLSNTVRTKCLCCESEVELDDQTIQQTRAFSREPESIYFGEVYSFESRSGYDSLTEEEQSFAKLYMLGKLDRACDCSDRKI